MADTLLPATRTETCPRRHAFSTYLRARREKLGWSLEHISKETKIPEGSLVHLETGAFEELPGDVFVRGFARAYARCVGLDPEEAIARYAACGLEPAPVAGKHATDCMAETSDVREHLDVVVNRQSAPPRTEAPNWLNMPPDGDPAAHPNRVTVAVVILAIVATITMSYLLRRPSGYGEGVTEAPTMIRDTFPKVSLCAAAARPVDSA